ncbi:MAG: response regulator transcription factor [Chloroflexota bacterium]|nr:response regulator transcription factor [Chloroflexota bacterium]
MEGERILVVDDDPGVLKFVGANLRARDYEVLEARDGREALQAMEEAMPHLIILDIMLPLIDGYEVCRRIRAWSQVPIIMLSAKGDERDKVLCLELGADDYVTKPFAVEELLARVRSVLRRSRATPTPPTIPQYVCCGLEVNFIERRVTVDGHEVRLTPIEYSLMQELALNAGKVLTHVHLLSRLWGPEYVDEREYLRVYISRLRHKIEADPENPQVILTEPGVGYRLCKP